MTRGVGRRTRVLVTAGVGVLLAGVIPGCDYPDGPPNDPGYPEQTYLFDHIPDDYPNASDPEGASGMFVDRAWRDFTTGRPDTVIAYVEGGVNWHAGDVLELADKVYVNHGELPLPCTSSNCPVIFGRPLSQYDVNHDDVFNVRDYLQDPRVSDRNGNGVLDPEDLIARFSNGNDRDANGYVDDISGWDFYTNQNDPATVDSTYDHANNQMRQAAAETNNGIGEAGICPRCLLLPIKAGAEALDRTDDLAEAWLYAVDAGADVIVSVTADLGYSTFMRQAVEYAARHNVVMVEASNDFNSTDHQGGMFWPHVLPGNGVVADRQGQPDEKQTTSTFRVRSNYTSWGTHNVFSAATDGGTTSEATPTVGGIAALLLSYGQQAADDGIIGRPLSNFEAVQLLRATASDIDDPSLPWPGKPGWDLQYGYGRPNVWRAMQAVSQRRIPPVGYITSPDWYTLYDPTRTGTVPVNGHVEARRSSSYRWTIDYAPGPEPADNQFIVGGSGNRTAPFDGRLGTIDLSRIPRSFWEQAFALSQDKSLETTERYTVTIRLRVTDAAGRVSEDRRSIAVHHDPSWVGSFPKRIGPGGEGQPALADLQATGRLAIVFGDSDGRVHAVDGQTGTELPGWPVRTNATTVTRPHPGVSPGHEPVVGNVAVADLDHNGNLSVVATSSTGTAYIWDSAGQREAGWPKPLTLGVSKPPIPRPALPFTRQPARGAFASPVLADLDDDLDLEIVQAGWNGYIHVWREDGSTLPGWPVKVQLPPGTNPPPGYVQVRDEKLESMPAIGDLDGDGAPEIVIRSQFTEVTGPGISFNGRGHLLAYHADGSRVSGFPNTFTTFATYYGSAQEFITEGSNSPVLADVEGDGNVEIAAGGTFGPTYLFEGNGVVRATYGGTTDLPVTFTTSGAFGRFGPGGLTLGYAQPGTDGQSLIDSLLAPGSGNPIRNVERAYTAVTGTILPGFPSFLQGLDFLGAPVIVDVTGDGLAEVVNAGDSSALHGYTATGGQAAGFPKFHTGWALWSPTAGDLTGNGTTEIVMMTREGYLFVWGTPGRATANVEWWHPNHDERNTGRYGNDTRPPGVVRDVQWTPGTPTASFVAPGDDWYTGRVTHYVVGSSPGFFFTTVPATAGAGARQTVTIPAGSHTLRIQPVDDAGNLGPRTQVSAG